MDREVDGRMEERGGGYPKPSPLFLTSKILPVRRNHSPPLKRTALLRHCFIPRSALPPWKRFLIPSEANALVNEAFRGSPSIYFVLHIPYCCNPCGFYFKPHLCDGSLLQFSSLGTGNPLGHTVSADQQICSTLCT